MASETKTFWFGRDCLGNTPHAETVEGTCIQDIYGESGRSFYNQRTGENGDVRRGPDGELHFYPETLAEEHMRRVHGDGSECMDGCDQPVLR